MIRIHGVQQSAILIVEAKMPKGKIIKELRNFCKPQFALQKGVYICRRDLFICGNIVPEMIKLTNGC